MTLRRLSTSLLACAALALGACAQMGGSSGSAGSAGSTASTAAAGEQTDTLIMLVPASGSTSALQSGCWATFYDERNFGGDSTTVVGPIELQTLDRGSARQLRRAIDSVVTGPRATLILYERQLFSNRSVGFQPGTREGSLIEKLGFGGRIESMRLQCS